MITPDYERDNWLLDLCEAVTQYRLANIAGLGKVNNGTAQYSVYILKLAVSKVYCFGYIIIII